MADAYEFEEVVTRGEAVIALREIADGVDSGSLRLGRGDEGTVVTVPDDVELEIELEREEGSLGIEIELEWPESDSSVDSIKHAEEAIGEDEEPPVGAGEPLQSLARFESFSTRPTSGGGGSSTETGTPSRRAGKGTRASTTPRRGCEV